MICGAASAKRTQKTRKRRPNSNRTRQYCDCSNPASVLGTDGCLICLTCSSMEAARKREIVGESERYRDAKPQQSNL